MSDVNAQLAEILDRLQSLTERVERLEARQMLVPDIERYGTLQQLLEKGDIRGADEETTRVILETASRLRDTMTPEDFRQFPCNVLRVIDRLWTRYSDGRFGFSVQVQIYGSVGGNINTLRSQDAETIRKFGDAVGWRADDKWRMDDYESWDFSLSAPEGSFPANWWKSPYGLKMATFCFTRLMECDLQ
ncbi:GUN4 domain-containing protein [Pannus brasiliensis]